MNVRVKNYVWRVIIKLMKTKNFGADLYLFKRPALNQFGHMIPFYKL